MGATADRGRERWALAVRRARGRARVAEAAVLLCAAAAAQRWVPMPRWSPVLGEPGGVPDAMRGPAGDGIPARAATTAEARVGSAIARANQRLPFEASCLAQATAGQVMLRRRHEPGVVVIGLRPPDPDESAWSAHAWLLGRDGALTGGPAAAGFTATTVFGIQG
jgi:hypothetical protein